MIARSRSWSERTPDRWAVAAEAAGVALFLGCFALLHAGPLSSFQIIDTPTYQRYGDSIVDAGAVPYRDFSLEYPPGALPVFVLPSLASSDDYRTVFELARSEAIFTGSSGGAAAFAARELARTLPPDAVVVTLFPDSGERYLSKLNRDWLAEKNLFDPDEVFPGA